MKRLLPLLICVAPVALVGCSKGPTVEAHNASVAEVAEKAQNAAKMKPGEWQMKSEVLDMTMPGVNNPQVAAMIKDRLGKQNATTVTYCVTPEEAARPAARMFAGDAAANCKYEHYTMGGGKIDAVMVCGAAGPNDVQRHSRMTMNGTFTDSSVDMVTTADGGSGDMKMTMKMHLVGGRVGECKPGEK